MKILLLICMNLVLGHALCPSIRCKTRKIVNQKAKTAAVSAGLATTAVSLLSRQSFDFTPETDSLTGQTILVTGGTTGLGLETCKRLAEGGATVVLTARSDGKGQAALSEIASHLRSKGIENDQISYQIVDLDNLASVKQAVEWSIPNIDVLVNNAGIMALPERELTIDGYEKQMQSNHLGHFVLTAALAPKLADDARVVMVSSTAHSIPGDGGLDWDYVWTGEPNYQPWKSYGMSKLANIVFTQELQRRADAAGKHWSVVTLHPGVVNTDLGRYLFPSSVENSALLEGASRWASSFLKTPAQGASTQIMLAARAETDYPAKARYFVDGKARPLGSVALDKAAALRLWEESERKAGIAFDIEKPILQLKDSASTVDVVDMAGEDARVEDEPTNAIENDTATETEDDDEGSEESDE